jgi:hypothetical protein
VGTTAVRISNGFLFISASSKVLRLGAEKGIEILDDFLLHNKSGQSTMMMNKLYDIVCLFSSVYAAFTSPRWPVQVENGAWGEGDKNLCGIGWRRKKPKKCDTFLRKNFSTNAPEGDKV